MFQVSEENGEQMACYSVSVSLSERDDTQSTCWSVVRKLSEFQALHRKLTEVGLLCVSGYVRCVFFVQTGVTFLSFFRSVFRH